MVVSIWQGSVGQLVSDVAPVTVFDPVAGKVSILRVDDAGLEPGEKLPERVH